MPVHAHEYSKGVTDGEGPGAKGLSQDTSIAKNKENKTGLFVFDAALTFKETGLFNLITRSAQTTFGSLAHRVPQPHFGLLVHQPIAVDSQLLPA